MPSIETLNGWGEAWAAVVIRGLIDSTVLLAAVSLAWLACGAGCRRHSCTGCSCSC